MMNTLIIVFFLLNIYCYVEAVDKVCYDQNVMLNKEMQKKDFYSKFTFHNESRDSMQLLWSDDNRGYILLVTTEERYSMLSKKVRPSAVYRSKDHGKTFTAITNQLDGGNDVYIRQAMGLQRHEHKRNQIYLVCHNLLGKETILFISENGGDSWTKSELPFLLHDEGLVFHPREEHHKMILGLDPVSKELFLSTDGGRNWKKILSRVESFAWSSHPGDSENTIFALQSEGFDFENWLSRLMDRMLRKGLEKHKLMKTTSAGENWHTLNEDTYAFSTKGKFLYISVVHDDDQLQRRLKVSTNSGESFDSVQLPDITHDRFYSILGMEDDMVFIHVDDPEDSGHGKLYMSDATGIIFSLSLERHLYPNFMSVTDFFRIDSMRATYITSQMNTDGTMHSVISHNRGAHWWPLKLPTNVNCPDQQGCSLQVSGAYSKQNQVRTELPLSSSSAVGIILLHGHTADRLKMHNPDVFVSSDGGYSWNKALDGPHHYQIADHGGLLIAVPADTRTPKVVKFSTDEGRCWHTYTFTEEDIQFTGLLTEPGNRGMVVAVYGFHIKLQQWIIHVIDFNRIVTNECKDSDYEIWYPHSEQEHPSQHTQFRGCVLGKKESFVRLKKDSLCANGYMHVQDKQEIECPCTKEDYSCEYGFTRPANQTDCVRDPNIAELDVCIKGHVERIKTLGYHRIPGDVCVGGFRPDPTQQVALNKDCDEEKNLLEVEEASWYKTLHPLQEDAHLRNGIHNLNYVSLERLSKSEATSKYAVKILLIVFGVGILLVAVVFVIRRQQMVRRQAAYRYSLLSTGPTLNSTSGTQPSTGANYGGMSSSHANDDEATSNLLPSSSSIAPQATNWFAPPLEKPPQSARTGFPFGRSYLSPVMEEPNGGRRKGFHDDSDVDLLE